MQCPVCHNEVAAQSAFCGHCGAPIAAAAPVVAPSAYVPPPAVAASSGLTPNAASALAYVTVIPAILFLFPLIEFGLGLGLFIVWLITILKASKGEWFKLPVIGDFALKQSQS